MFCWADLPLMLCCLPANCASCDAAIPQVLLDGVPCAVTAADLNAITCVPGAKPQGSGMGQVYRHGPAGLLSQAWRGVAGVGGMLTAFGVEPRYPASPNDSFVRVGARPGGRGGGGGEEGVAVVCAGSRRLLLVLMPSFEYRLRHWVPRLPLCVPLWPLLLLLLLKLVPHGLMLLLLVLPLLPLLRLTPLLL